MAPANDGEDGTSVGKESHLNGESSLVGPASSTEATTSATNNPNVDGAQTSRIAPSQSASDQTPEEDKSIRGGEEEASVSSLSPRAGDNLEAEATASATDTPNVDGTQTSKMTSFQSTLDQTPEKDKSILGGEEDEAGVSSLSPSAGDKMKEAEATANVTNTPNTDGTQTSKIAPSQSTSDQTPEKDNKISGGEEEAGVFSLSPTAGDNLKEAEATANATNTPNVDGTQTSKIASAQSTSDQTPEKDILIPGGEEAGVPSLSPTAGDNLNAGAAALSATNTPNMDSTQTSKIASAQSTSDQIPKTKKSILGGEEGGVSSFLFTTTGDNVKAVSSPLTTKTGGNTEKDSSNTNDDGTCFDEAIAKNEKKNGNAVSLESPTAGGTKPLESDPKLHSENIERSAVKNATTSPDGGPLCQPSSLGNQKDDKKEQKLSASTDNSSPKGLAAAAEMEKQEKAALPSTTTTKEGEKPSNESASLSKDTAAYVTSPTESSTYGTEQTNGKKSDFSQRSVPAMPKQTSDRASESDKETGEVVKSDASLAKRGSSSLELKPCKQQTAPNQRVEIDSSDDSLLGNPVSIAKKKKNPTTSLAAKPPSKAKPVDIPPPDTYMMDAFARNAKRENKDEPLISESLPKPPTNAYEIAEQTKEPGRTQHKHMLLKLFLNVDEETLRELKGQCDKARPAETQRLSEQNRRRQRTSSPSNILLVPREEKLGLLPTALQELQYVYKKQASDKHPSLIIEDSKKRKSYSSRSLQDLEHLVNANFLESRLYKDTANETLVSPKQQHSEQTFTPFALEYNECSISAITLWGRKGSAVEAGQPPENSRKAWTDPVQNDRPAVSALFRKCTVCSRYGHYEIECSEMLKDETALLALAQKTKMQGIRSELLEKGKDPHDLDFRHVGFGKIREKKGKAEEEPPENDLARKYFRCELCHSGADDDNMLICDGCDKLFHLYCLDPPLEKVPDGDWFCLECEVSTRNVDSDVEIEACEDFVIEQRKKPREDDFLSKEKGFGFAKDDGWNTTMAVVGDDANGMPDDNCGLSPIAKRRRKLPYREEETEIDGFFITAKATSDSLDIARRIKASHVSTEDMSKAPLVTGSIVLWFTALLEEEENTTNGTSEESAAMVVGAVLAVDAVSREALVRPIPEWKQMVLDFRAENDSDLLPRLDECAMRAVSSASTVWIPTESLHLVAHKPPEDALAAFSDILPERVANERRKRDPSNLVAPQQSRKKARVR
jgi:hypothetical protein